uniref:Uncharacterized protein n=1 Tax=Knipowitschia caucasica TaxID=637954 RepID=A0AAV2MHY4_KNICA
MISESATPGTRFPLESAIGSGRGIKRVTHLRRDYEQIYFHLDVPTQSDGTRYRRSWCRSEPGTGAACGATVTGKNAPRGNSSHSAQRHDQDDGPYGDELYTFSNHVSIREKELFGV